jgi:hypothetical protein
MDRTGCGGLEQAYLHPERLEQDDRGPRGEDDSAADGIWISGTKRSSGVGRENKGGFAPRFRCNSVTYLKMRSKETNLARHTRFGSAIDEQQTEASFEDMATRYAQRKRRLRAQHAMISNGCPECPTISSDGKIHARDQSTGW